MPAWPLFHAQPVELATARFRPNGKHPERMLMVWQFSGGLAQTFVSAKKCDGQQFRGFLHCKKVMRAGAKIDHRALRKRCDGAV